MNQFWYSIKKDPSRLILTVIFAFLSLWFLIPLLWMLSASAKIESEVLVFPIQWIPEHWNFIDNFKSVWMGKHPFWLFYLNSLKLSTVMTASTLIFSSMAGYAFAKLRFPMKNFLFACLLSFMIIPEQATLVPRYIFIKELGLYNTHAGLIIMGMFSMYFTFLLRQFMDGIHNEYLEAARIDGAGFFRTYWQIMLPLSKPILATVGIIKFIWIWNDYQNPLIFLYSQKLYPITMGIQFFKDQYADNYAVTMTASLSAILPLLIVFIVLQKQVIAGISLGGVKG